MGLYPVLGNPPASMGFVGFIRFNISGLNQLIRANSCDVALSQAIDAPDVIDGRYDRTIYSLQPFEVGGSVEFPAIYGTGASCASPAGILLGFTTYRTPVGKLIDFDIDVKYSGQASTDFAYPDCIVDTWSFTGTQSEQTTCNVGLIGTKRDPSALTIDSDETPVTRSINWNDLFINIEVPSIDGGIIQGQYVRSFTVEINNNAIRIYTLNNSLYPQDISPTKRDITGSIVFMGRQAVVSQRALENVTRCSENSTIQFGYSISSPGCCGDLNVTFPNIVFQIEEIALTNDLLETTVNWRSLPDSQDQLWDGFTSGVPLPSES